MKKHAEVSTLHLKMTGVKEYPQRLQHATPTWVKDGSLFHIRIRVNRAQPCALTEPDLSTELIAAAKRYHDLGHWWCELFLLMPDHLHALLRFPPERGMMLTVKNWKQGTARFQGVHWQDNFSITESAINMRRMRNGITSALTQW